MFTNVLLLAASALSRSHHSKNLATSHCTEMREKLKVNIWRGKAIVSTSKRSLRIFYSFHIFLVQLESSCLMIHLQNHKHATSLSWTAQSHPTSPKKHEPTLMRKHTEYEQDVTTILSTNSVSLRMFKGR